MMSVDIRPHCVQLDRATDIVAAFGIPCPLSEFPYTRTFAGTVRGALMSDGTRFVAHAVVTGPGALPAGATVHTSERIHRAVLATRVPLVEVPGAGPDPVVRP
jgi:hypothetical protein